MPEQRQVSEYYWTTCYKEFNYPCGIKWCHKRVWGVRIPYPCGTKYCKGNMPYPCRKTRTVTKWCYEFDAIHENCKVGIATNYGCENGVEYKWRSACFGWFNAYHVHGPYVKCFEEQLDDQGDCDNTYPKGGQAPVRHIPDDSVTAGLRDTDASTKEKRE